MHVFSHFLSLRLFFFLSLFSFPPPLFFLRLLLSHKRYKFVLDGRAGVESKLQVAPAVVPALAEAAMTSAFALIAGLAIQQPAAPAEARGEQPPEQGELLPWRHDAAGRIVHAPTGLCLDVDTADNASVILWPLRGSASEAPPNQTWTISQDGRTVASALGGVLRRARANCHLCVGSADEQHAVSVVLKGSQNTLALALSTGGTVQPGEPYHKGRRALALATPHS